MIKKLVNLIKNYDTIIEMIEEYNKNSVKVKKIESRKEGEHVTYSIFNVPNEQKEYIVKRQKGEL